MSTLDFQDREPELERSGRPNNQLFADNSAFYQRLQGQGRKGAMERYGWIALPIAAVAIIGVVAATSTPHESANDVAGAPGQTASISNPTPAKPSIPPVVNEALATNDAAPAPEQATPAKPAVVASSSASAPAPVRVARKAASSSSAVTTTRPAAAAPVQRTAPTADTSVNPPTPAPAPAPTVTQDAAPQPAAPAAPAPSTDSSASQPAPAEATPAQ